MRLHPDYITHISDDELILVATGESTSKFCGIAKGNETTLLIIERLKKGATREELIVFLESEFDVQRQVLEEDVDMVLNKLQSIGALVDE